MALWVAIILIVAILSAGILCWACCAAGARADEAQRKADTDLEPLYDWDEDAAKQ